MLSSPVIPPSALDPEEVRLAALPSRAKTLYSLEWACLKARQKRWDDEDTDRMFTLGRCQEVDEDGTEPGSIHLESNAVTPESDAPFQDRKNVLFSRPNMRPQLEDVEAAITLLGFKTRS